MSVDPGEKRAVEFVIWLISGIVLLIILTSCRALDPFASLAAAPPAVTATRPAAVTAVTAAPPTPTPLPRYTVASDALQVRNGPSESARHVAYLTHGQTVTIYQTAQAAAEYCMTWAKISPSAPRWVCLQFLKGQQP